MSSHALQTEITLLCPLFSEQELSHRLHSKYFMAGPPSRKDPSHKHKVNHNRGYSACKIQCVKHLFCSSSTSSSSSWLMASEASLWTSCSSVISESRLSHSSILVVSSSSSLCSPQCCFSAYFRVLLEFSATLISGKELVCLFVSF